MKTTRGHATAELMRSAFVQLSELDKVASNDVDEIVGAVVSTIRGLRPESVSPLGILPPPTEVPADPRAE